MGLVFVINRPGYRIAADRKILKRSEATLVQEITHAYERAQGEITATLDTLETVCTKAKDEAYRKGLAQAELEAARRWTSIEVDRKALIESMRPALAELVFEAVTKLAKGLDREALLRQALELLQGSLRAASWARLHVHPEAIEVAESALDDFARRTGLGRLARVIADDTLPATGCRFESDVGSVDVSLDTQLQAIRGALIHD
jgi:type III secretion protein L